VKLRLTLQEENRLRILNNRVLRKIFGPKREEVIEGWKTLYKMGLHDFYSLSHINNLIKRKGMRRAGHVVCMEEKKNVCVVLVDNVEGKNLLARTGSR
jgi:hypothetical protein